MDAATRDILADVLDLLVDVLDFGPVRSAGAPSTPDDWTHELTEDELQALGEVVRLLWTVTRPTPDLRWILN
jgi:hypothetical protein